MRLKQVEDAARADLESANAASRWKMRLLSHAEDRRIRHARREIREGVQFAISRLIYFNRLFTDIIQRRRIQALCFR